MITERCGCSKRRVLAAWDESDVFPMEVSARATMLAYINDDGNLVPAIARCERRICRLLGRHTAGQTPR